MPKTVEFPELGSVDFPDSMSWDQVQQTIADNHKSIHQGLFDRKAKQMAVETNAESEPPGIVDKYVQGIRSIGKGAISGVAGLSKAIGETAAFINRKVYDGGEPGTVRSGNPEDLTTFKLGKGLQDAAEEASPDIPGLEGSFWFNDVPSGIGQVGGALVTGGGAGVLVEGGAAKLGVQGAAKLGTQAAVRLGLTEMAGAEFDDAYQRSLERGDTPDMATGKAAAYSVLATAIESKLGLGRIAKRFGFGEPMKEMERAAKENLAKVMVKEAAAGFSEEALQRAAQDYIVDGELDVNAIAREGGAGAVVQALLGAVGHSSRRKHAQTALNWIGKAQADGITQAEADASGFEPGTLTELGIHVLDSNAQTDAAAGDNIIIKELPNPNPQGESAVSEILPEGSDGSLPEDGSVVKDSLTTETAAPPVAVSNNPAVVDENAGMEVQNPSAALQNQSGGVQTPVAEAQNPGRVEDNTTEDVESEPSLTRRTVKKIVARVASALPGLPKIIITRDNTEWPAELQAQFNGRKPRAAFHGGAIFMASNEFENPKEVQTAVMHEGVGHYGIRFALTDTFDGFMESVYRAHRDTDLGRRIQDTYQFDHENLDDQIHFAEEVVAHLAEQPRLDPTLWRRVVEAVKTGWRKVTGGAVSEDEIHRVIRKAYRNLQQDAASADAGTARFSVSPEDRAAERERQLRAEVPGYSDISKYLTPTERGKLMGKTAANLVAIHQSLPSVQEMAAVAEAGKSKRGWYRKMAALSPQTSVESNLYNALQTWKNWTAAGRPTNPDEILKIMAKSVEGQGDLKSVLDAWRNNSIKSLTHDFEKGKLVLSGPKVNSFMLNVLGDVHEVTNDAWMANYALVDQVIFGGTGVNKAGTDPGKGAGYMAMSAKVRAAAAYLSKISGERWTPAEVQETVWSWAKTLYELQVGGKNAVDVLKEKGITDAMVGATPDFATLFTKEGKYANILSDAGYQSQLQEVREKSRTGESSGREAGPNYSAGEAGSTPETGRLRHLNRAASRLAELQRRREAESAGTLELFLYGGEVHYRAGSSSRSGRGISHARGGNRLKPITAEEFSAIATANKAANRFGTSVDVRSPGDYDGFDLILLRDGDRTVTISISPDGEVGSVTKSETADRIEVQAAMQAAAATGRATWLNGFDTILPGLYTTFGFEPVARVAFDDQYAPQGWDYQLYSKFKGGRPDVVFMRYTGVPEKYDPAKAVPVGSYDEAAAMAKGKGQARFSIEGERQHGQKLKETSKLDDPIKDRIENWLYQRRDNASDAAFATSMVHDYGIPEAMNLFRDDRNGLPEAVRTMLGHAVITAYGQQERQARINGQISQANHLAEQAAAFIDQDILPRSTSLAQALQAFAAFTQLTPAGWLAVSRRAVNKARGSRLAAATPDISKALEAMRSVNEAVIDRVDESPAVQAAAAKAVDASVEESPEIEWVVREQAAEKFAGLRELIKDHFSGRNPGKSLVEKLQLVYQLKPEEAAKKAKSIEAAWKQEVERYKGQVKQRLRQERSLWKQYQDGIAGQVVSLVQSKLRGPAKDPALVGFSDRLANVLKAHVEKHLKVTPGSPAPKLSPAKIIAEALNNPQKYHEAWITAVDALRNEFSGQPAVLQRLEDAIRQRPDLIAPGPLEKAVSKKFQEMRGNMGKVVRSHYLDRAAVGRTLADRLVQEAGVQGAAALQLAQAVQAKFKQLAGDRKVAELRKLAKQGGGVLNRKTVAQRIIELSNLGAFEDRAALEAVAERMGLPSFTSEAAKEITKMATELQALPKDSHMQKSATIKMMSYIARQEGLRWWDLPLAFWYANTLSGPITHLVNAGSNMISLGGNLATTLVRRPTDVLAALSATADGFLKGGPEALAVLKTGIQVRSTKLDAVGTLERVQDSDYRNLGVVLNKWKYVGRALAAADQLFFFSAREVRSAVLARAVARKEGLSGKARQARVQVLLGSSPEAKQAAEAQAMAEGVTGLDYARRVNELMDAARPADLAEDAEQWALRATFNNKPYGLLGAIADGINLVNRKTVITRMVIPFVNVVANVTNESLNYSPVGFGRAAWAHWNIRKGEGALLYGQEISDRELIYEAYAKAAVGTTMVAALVSIAAKGLDDDDYWFALSGQGPASRDRNKALRETGWIPYSIRVHGTYYNFANTSLAIPLGIAGNYLDAMKYGNLEQADALTRVAFAVGTAGHVLMQQSFLDSLARLMGSLDHVSDKKAGDRATDVVARALTTIAVPQALRQVDRMFDSRVMEPMTVKERLVAQIPFVRRGLKPALNALGDPIRREPLDRIVSGLKRDDVWLELSKVGAVPSMPEQGLLTPEEHYDLVEYRAAILRPQIEAKLGKIVSSPPTEARKIVNGLASSATERSKKALGLTAVENARRVEVQGR